MPLKFVKYPTQDTCLGGWEITESLDELIALYPMVEEKAEFQALKSEKRKVQWLAARILANDLMLMSDWPVSQILKDIENKPYTENPPYHISISHSHHFCAAMISKNYSVGVDIENYDRDFQRVKHKYLNDEELAIVQDSDEDACLYWTVKEAVYKIVGKPVYNFKETIFAQRPVNDAVETRIQPLNQCLKVNYFRFGLFYISFTWADFK